MEAQRKFAVGSAIILATLVLLGYVGYSQSKTYHYTISEVAALRGPALHERMCVSGNVRSGSISHRDGRVDFVLEEQGKVLPVSYTGADPLPDTFKDGAQAVVEGRMMPDGEFTASKYEAAPGGTAQPASSGAPPNS